MSALTKTEARRLARRTLSYGYFAEDDLQRKAHVRCPRCRLDVHATHYETSNDARSRNTLDAGNRRLLVKALEAAVVEHLTSEYDAERCTAA